jgi:hypothetical protein
MPLDSPPANLPGIWGALVAHTRPRPRTWAYIYMHTHAPPPSTHTHPLSLAALRASWLRFHRTGSYAPRELSSAHLGHMGGALVAHFPFAGYSTYVLFFRHSGPRLYPLTKSAGHQTSFMCSCPSTYEAHKNIRWSKRGPVRLGVLRFASHTALSPRRGFHFFKHPN